MSSQEGIEARVSFGMKRTWRGSLAISGLQEQISLLSLCLRFDEESSSPPYRGERDAIERDHAIPFIRIFALF